MIEFDSLQNYRYPEESSYPQANDELIRKEFDGIIRDVVRSTRLPRVALRKFDPYERTIFSMYGGQKSDILYTYDGILSRPKGFQFDSQRGQEILLRLLTEKYGFYESKASKPEEDVRVNDEVARERIGYHSQSQAYLGLVFIREREYLIETGATVAVDWKAVDRKGALIIKNLLTRSRSRQQSPNGDGPQIASQNSPN